MCSTFRIALSKNVEDSTGRNIYDARYDGHGSSKANRLRGFWQIENNRLVGKLLSDLLDYATSEGHFRDQADLVENCRAITTRLQQDTTVPELDALMAISDD